MTNMTFGGITIRSNPYLPSTRSVPVKKHAKRKGSAAYHRRVQKKWTKRYGMKQERVAYVVDMAALGLGGGREVFINPSVLAMIRGLP